MKERERTAGATAAGHGLESRETGMGHAFPRQHKKRPASYEIPHNLFSLGVKLRISGNLSENGEILGKIEKL